MRDFSDRSRYFSFPGFHEEGKAVMEDIFGGKYGRLARIEARYDPHNLFHLNPNIEPKQ